MTKLVEYLGCISTPSQAKEWLKGKFLNGYAQTRIAFVGRSNVGKSSLLNELVSQNVARVSKVPGKTQKVHFFLDTKLNKIWVDLPGYGYAQKSKDLQNEWVKIVESYLRVDENLGLLFLLWDSKVGPTPLDRDAFVYIRDKLNIQVFVLMTKLDQLKKQSDRSRRKKEIEKELLTLGCDPKAVIWVSTYNKNGLKDVLKKIQEFL